MKIVRLDIDENSILAGVDAVALVEQPAIEEDFMYFSKDEFAETYNDYPEGAVEAAKMGIKRNKELGNKCGTQVGKVRAQQLANREPISLDTVRRMRAFLIHQKGNYDLAIERKDYNACGYISYLLWGGPEALPWAEKILRRAEGEEFAEVGPRGGIKASPKAPKSDTPNPSPKGRGTAKGDASTTRGAKVDKATEETLQKKADEFNKKYKDKLGYGANIGALKSVYQRGLGAYNTSRSPAVAARGGAKQWAMARVNAFLYLLKNGRPQNKKYTADYDLLPTKHPKKEAMTTIIEAFAIKEIIKQEMAMQLYDTKEKAEAAAEALGCKGAHQMPDGKWMPCAEHQEMEVEVSTLPDYIAETTGSLVVKDTFAALDEEQIVLGPVMKANKLILRRDENNEEYYVYFSEEAIKRIAYKMMKDKLIDKVNLEHDPNRTVEDAYLVESWLVEDPATDKSRKYGFNPTKGDWFAAYKIDNDAIWNDYVKTGKVKGFSAEGFFSNYVEKMSMDVCAVRKGKPCMCGKSASGLCDGSHNS